jgi:hypothetical protein
MVIFNAAKDTSTYLVILSGVDQSPQPPRYNHGDSRVSLSDWLDGLTAH